MTFRDPGPKEVAQALLKLKKKTYRNLLEAVKNHYGCSMEKATRALMAAMESGVFGLLGKELVLSEAEVRRIASCGEAHG